jgi:hypothetical protein
MSDSIPQLRVEITQLDAKLDTLVERIDRLSSQVNEALQTDPEGIATIRLASYPSYPDIGTIWGHSITIIDPEHRRDHHTNRIGSIHSSCLKAELLALRAALEQLRMYSLPSNMVWIISSSTEVRDMISGEVEAAISKNPEYAELVDLVLTHLQPYNVRVTRMSLDQDSKLLKLTRQVLKKAREIEERECSQPAESESSPKTPVLMSTNPAAD